MSIFWRSGAEAGEAFTYSTSAYNSTLHVNHGVSAWDMHDVAAYTQHTFTTQSFASEPPARTYGQLYLYMIQANDSSPINFISHQSQAGVGGLVSLKINNSRQVQLVVTGSVVATTTSQLSISAWNRIQWQVYWNGASSVFEVRLPDVGETITSNQNIGSDALQYIIFSGGSWNNAGDGWWLDDIELRDDVYPNAVDIVTRYNQNQFTPLFLAGS